MHNRKKYFFILTINTPHTIQKTYNLRKRLHKIERKAINGGKKLDFRK